VRDGVAARALQGIIPATRHVETFPRQTRVPCTAVRRAPAADAEQLDQLLFGEVYEVLDETAGWAFGQAARDGYVGYVDASMLGASPIAPTHTVRALRSYGYAAPSIKSAPTGLYSMNTLLTETGRDGRFVNTAAGWFVADHLAPVEDVETDLVSVALRFVGTPYHWGGRESLGLDCSGLVQQSFYACGRLCPRDSDQQAALGEAIDLPRRGDLAFWPGHVAIFTGPDEIVHASGHHMAVVVEPLAEATARIARQGSGAPPFFRRP
jgi:cell wall-associated NlpC family hydrolase